MQSISIGNFDLDQFTLQCKFTSIDISKMATEMLYNNPYIDQPVSGR